MGRPRKHPRQWFRAKEAFAFVDEDDGTHYSFHQGDLLPDGKLLRKCIQFFEPLEPDYPVEQATAAPGEKRER